MSLAPLSSSGGDLLGKLTVIDQQPGLPFDAVEPGHRQVWFSQGGAGDRECVDRVGLAECAGTVARE